MVHRCLSLTSNHGPYMIVYPALGYKLGLQKFMAEIMALFMEPE